MSVYIKGMKMPKSCCECWFMEGADEWCCAHRGRYLEPDYRIAIKDKPDWCPLVEVPPHGRLIDADALHKLFEDQWHYLQVLDWNENPTAEARQSGVNWCINTMHDSAPTVIEAEEGE